MCNVSTKTIEDICQLLQCQPQDLMEWKVDLNIKSEFIDFPTASFKTSLKMP